jgi:sigma-B regulation protein RsbU (phosphoserine phosphatase)
MDAGPIFQSSIEELEIELRKGDLVLQYTDGVIEAMNEQREEFGSARLNDVVRKYGKFEAEYVLWRIEKELDTWLGGKTAQDDITMIAFKVES